MDDDSNKYNQLIFSVILFALGLRTACTAVFHIETIKRVCTADTEQYSRITPFGDGLDTP